MSKEAFKIRVGEFEGPVEVLLNLIEDKKLHISQVSLATVTDDFILYLEKLDRTDKTRRANFILVAATLMLIKSVSLLPTIETTPEEQESMVDLERRLKIYQQIKELSGEIKNRFGNKIIFSRGQNREIVPVFSVTPEINLKILVATVKNLITLFPKVETLPKIVVSKIISLEEAIADLTKRIQSSLKIGFRDLVRGRKERVNVIVSFLGILELVRQGVIEVEQSVHFADITLEASGSLGPPRYDTIN